MDQENKSIRIKDNSNGMDIKEINERFLVFHRKIKKELREKLEEVSLELVKLQLLVLEKF